MKNKKKICIERYKANYLIDDPELSNLRLFRFLLAFLIITDIVMPQYFGVHLGYDMTCTRFADVFILLYFFLNRRTLTGFWQVIERCSMTIPLVLYLFVAAYTMVFRVDINSFFLVFIEIMTFYMLIYGVRYVVGVKKALKWAIGCAYFLSFYGLIEFVCGRSLFLMFLRTMPTQVVNSYRSGHYRIMGPCGHPLGYGLLLLFFIAIACLDYDKDEIYIYKRPVLLVLIIANVFLTGSRSTLGIAILEILVLLLMSNAENVKKSLFFTLIAIFLLGIFLLCTFRTGIGRYILMQICSVLDQAFGTTWAVNFGADITTLQNSEEYRKYLPLIFTLDWLNPLVGRGVSRAFSVEFDGVYIYSLDSYYISQYVKYAYPGMITYILFILTAVGTQIYGMIKYRCAIFKATFAALVSYFVNLYYLDHLQTLKFMYLFTAISFAALLCMKKKESEESV